MIPIEVASKSISGYIIGFVREVNEDGVTDIQIINPDISSLELEKYDKTETDPTYLVIFTDLDKAEEFMNEYKITSYLFKEFGLGYCDIEIEIGTMYYKVPDKGYIIVPQINNEQNESKIKY